LTKIAVELAEEILEEEEKLLGTDEEHASFGEAPSFELLSTAADNKKKRANNPVEHKENNDHNKVQRWRRIFVPFEEPTILRGLCTMAGCHEDYLDSSDGEWKERFVPIEEQRSFTVRCTVAGCEEHYYDSVEELWKQRYAPAETNPKVKLGDCTVDGCYELHLLDANESIGDYDDIAEDVQSSR
jgi:hypothetical protein